MRPEGNFPVSDFTDLRTTTLLQGSVMFIRVIHSYVVNDKIDNLLFFWPDSECLKMMFGKMQKFF